MKAKVIPAIETLDQLNATVDEVARINVEIRTLEAARDLDLQTVRERHDGPIEFLKKKMKGLVALAETYGLARREAVFGKQKSAASKLARFGFREGNPALCLLNKKWTWPQVMTALKDQALTRFIRTIEEVDKEALKAAKLSDGDLAAIGLRLDSKERFYVEPKVDDAERIVADNAA